ncbi:MAG: sirohydrochlorin chelatase [Pirellulales bacterium]|nr:sirohydrochlorin chelatase [Pirellulales bacterium]
MPTRQSSDGLLMIGHGTLESSGVADFFQIVEQVEGLLPQVPVQGCFLELAAPNIASGVRALHEKGVRWIRAVPLLLFAAAHVRRDIPEALAAARAENPGVEIQQCNHLGCHPKIVELSSQRCREVLAAQPNCPVQETLLILVGRGSRDKRATQEMHDFAELRRQATPAVDVRVAFLAMERPRLDEVLRWAATAGVRRVVVQPHLLFPGCLVDQVRAAVSHVRKEYPSVEWVVVGSLGRDRRIAEAIASLATRGMDRQNRVHVSSVSEGQLAGSNPPDQQSDLVSGWISG